MRSLRSRHLLAGFTTTPDSIADEGLAVFTGRKRRLTVPTASLVEGAEAGVRPGMLDVYGDQADDLVGDLVDRAGHFRADDRPDAVTTHALELFGRVLL
jgi:hypothetical protein